MNKLEISAESYNESYICLAFFSFSSFTKRDISQPKYLSSYLFQDLPP